VTALLLVRHASHALVGKALAGRSEGVRLDERGRRQADLLSQRLAAWSIAAVYTSPRERAVETATPVARRLGLALRVDSAFDEIDFGDWTGRTFSELAHDPAWPLWVDRRSVAQPPNGEHFADVQRRAVDGIDRLRARHPEETVAVFSHGDVIKSVLAHFLGMTLDHLERFDLAPASVSLVAAGDGWAQVKLINDTTAADAA
jgi:probable phosphomutase (TIGR03848 family)